MHRLQSVLWVCLFGEPHFIPKTRRMSKCTPCVPRVEKRTKPACVTSCFVESCQVWNYRRASREVWLKVANQASSSNGSYRNALIQWWKKPKQLSMDRFWLLERRTKTAHALDISFSNGSVHSGFTRVNLWTLRTIRIDVQKSGSCDQQCDYQIRGQDVYFYDQVH